MSLLCSVIHYSARVDESENILLNYLGMDRNFKYCYWLFEWGISLDMTEGQIKVTINIDYTTMIILYIFCGPNC